MVWVAFSFLVIGLAGGVVLGRKTYDRNESIHTRHLARWVDSVLSDDMVRPVLPQQTLEYGKKLVREYYGRL